MHNQSARVVFSACLVAAIASAQAPASFESYNSFSGNPVAGSSAPAPDANPSWLTGPGTGIRGLTAFDQQEEDYSLRTVFQTAHGDFLMRRERYDPQIEVKARFFPSANIEDEVGNFDLLQYDVDVDLAAPIYPDVYLIFGAFYNARRYMTSDTFQLGDETLYETGAHVGFGAFLDDNLLFELRCSPGLWSDLDGTVHSKDLDFPGEATLTMRAADNFFWKVGAQYSQLYEETPWLPVLGLHWEVFEGFRIDVELPKSMELSMWPSASTGFLFGVDVTGGQYHVRNSLAQGDQRTDVQVQEVTTYVGAMHRMNDNMSIYGRVGLALSGDYDLADGTPGNRVEGDFDQTFFFQVGFGFDF